MRNGDEPVVMIVTPGLKGGSWTRLRDIANLASKRHRIVIVGYGKRPHDLSERCRVFALPFFEYSTKPFLYHHPFAAVLFSLPLAVVSCFLFLCFRPRVVVANGNIMAYYLLPLVKLLRRKMIMSYHGWTEDIVKGFAERLSIWLDRYIECVVTNSEGSRSDIERLIHPEKVLVSEHYADPVFFESREMRRAYRDIDLENRFGVLYVGRIDREKNSDTLIEAIPETLAINRRVVFLFCGEGELSERVKELADEYPENVYYLGYVGQKRDLISLYSVSDVVWSYADETYLARPAVEGLACGKPVLIVDRPALSAKRHSRDAVVPASLVPDAIGRLVPTGNSSRAGELILAIAEGEMTFDHEAIRAYAGEHYSIRNLDVILDVLDAYCTPRT